MLPSAITYLCIVVFARCRLVLRDDSKRFSHESHSAYALVAGSCVFVALTTYARMGFGLSGAASQRYAYVVVVLLIPALGLLFTLVLERWRLPLPAANLFLVARVGFNSYLLVIAADSEAIRELTSRQRVVDGLAALIANPDDPDLLNRPLDPEWSPDLLGSDALGLFEAGQLPLR